MADSWLNTFANTLAGIESTPGAQMHGASTPSAISQILSARVQDAAPANNPGPPASGGFWGNTVTGLGPLNGIANAIAGVGQSGGQHLLDLLGRTGSASANFKDYQLTHETPNAGVLGNILQDFKNLPGAAEAGLQGLEGKHPESYANVLEHQGVTNPWVKGIGGFAGDVAFDPLSLAGPTEVKAGAKLADAGLQKLGVDIPGALSKIGKPTNADALISGAEKTFAPAVENAAPAAVAPTTLEHIAPVNTPLAESAGLAEKASPLARTAEPFAGDVTPVHPMPTPAVYATPAEAMTNTQKLAEATGKLAPVAKPLATPAAVDVAKANLNRAQLLRDSLLHNHNTLLQNVEVHVPQVAEDIAKPAAETIAPTVAETAAPAVATNAADTLKEGIRNVANENLNPALKQVNLLGRSGLPLQDISKGAIARENAGMTIPAKALLDAARTGKIPLALENAYVKVNGKLTSLPDHLGELHNDFLLGDTFGATRDATKSAIPAVEPAVVKPATTTKNFADMAELQAARQAKQLTPAAEAAYKARMAQLGYRSHTQVTAALKRAEDGLTKAKSALTADPMANAAHAANVQTNVAKVLAGDTTAVGPKVAPAALNDSMVKAVQDITKHVHDYALVNPNSKRAVFDKFSQMTLGKRVIAEANKMTAGLPEAQKASAMYDHAMPMLDASERIFRENGVPLMLGKTAQGLPVSIHDVLSSLPRAFVEKFYFTRNNAPGITHMADIAEQFIKHGLGEVPTADLNNSVKDILMRSMGKSGAESMLTKTIKQYGGLDTVANEFTKAFTQAQPHLLEALTRNATADSLREGIQSKELTQAVIDHVGSIINNPSSSVADIVKNSLDTHSITNKVADAAGIPKVGPARGLAEQAAKAATARALPLPAVQVAAKGAKELAKATTKDAAVKVATELSKSAESEVENLFKNDPAALYDMATKAHYTSGVATLRKTFPIVGMEQMLPRMRAGFSTMQDVNKKFYDVLANASKQHTQAEFEQAFRMWQEGGTEVTPALKVLQDVAGHLFTVDNPELGIISRNFNNIKQVAEKMPIKGLPQHKIDPLNPDASWRTWKNVTDPLDTIHRFHAAVNHALAEQEFGAQVTRFFGKDTPLNDGNKWVKIVDTKGASKTAALIDTSKYYPENIAHQFRFVDDTLKELLHPSSSSGGLIKGIDTGMHLLKTGLTAYHPGHHLGNAVGNAWLNFIAGVNPLSYKPAMAMMAARPGYEGFDVGKSMAEAYPKGSPKTLLTMTVDGKPVHLNAADLSHAAFQNGVLHKFQTIADTEFGHQSAGVDKFLQKMSPLNLIGQGGQGSRFVKGVSEANEHLFRLAQFHDYLNKLGPIKGPDALEKAFAGAGDTVRKWHPDGSDMTASEKKYARRAILFYSWVRKAIPLVIESAVMHPGRFTVYNKATNNLAKINGINLNQGLGNPFPVDQLFPNYISDSTQGPEWGHSGSYAGLKLKIPGNDIMDQYFSSPLKTVQTIAGGANPLLRIPFEVATQRQSSSGAPLPRADQYIDRQLPFGSVLDQLTGHTLSSGFTNPVPVSKANTGYQGNPNTGGGNIRTIINQLTGSNLTDYSSPGIIKGGQLDLKARLKAAANGG